MGTVDAVGGGIEAAHIFLLGSTVVAPSFISAERAFLAKSLALFLTSRWARNVRSWYQPHSGKFLYAGPFNSKATDKRINFGWASLSFEAV